MAATWHLGVAERKASGLGSGQNFGGIFKKSCSSMNGACHKVMLGLTVDSEQIFKRVGPSFAPRSVVGLGGS